MQIFEEIDDVYRRYGFDTGYSCDRSTHRSYTIRSGYFHQAEIIVFESSAIDSVERTRHQLEAAGFACTTRAFSDVDSVRRRLFEGFFGVAETRARHREHYKAFRNRQTRATGAPYQYVSGPYALDDRRNQDVDVVSSLLQVLKQTQPTLILIEAAAGYGKTCTAYELLNALVENEPNRPPLFVELARNRQAPLFRYVLLDEIDRNYPSLRSDLVETQIADGNVILIIDGFDELLRRAVDGKPSQEEPNLESMLDTIAELLRGSAKIVLTTRRTAVFSSDTFHAWASTRSNQFRSVRVLLEPPQIRDWLGAERAKQVEALGTLSQALANPVLLSFLRPLSDEQFGRYMSDQDQLVQHYFTSLLERELDRQDINIPVSEQLTIYRRLAHYMIPSDFAVETRKEIASIIRNTSTDILDAAIPRYPAATRPTVEQLADKLAGHALLDRVGQGTDQIGFVNEFVAGTLIGDALISNPTICSEKFLDLASSAYQIRSDSARRGLYSAIQPFLQALLPQEQLLLSIRLIREMDSDLVGETIEGFKFDYSRLGDPHQLSDCTFVDCTFVSCALNGVAFARCGFLECRFHDCTFTNGASECWQMRCVAFPDDGVFDSFIATNVGAESQTPDSLEKRILQQFWPKGRAHANSRITKHTLFRGFGPTPKELVEEALDRLRRSHLVHTEGDIVYLHLEKMSLIRDRLGR